jgi:hypothetical protein
MSLFSITKPEIGIYILIYDIRKKRPKKKYSQYQEVSMGESFSAKKQECRKGNKSQKKQDFHFLKTYKIADEKSNNISNSSRT